MTKPNRLWTNGQVERMNRAGKDATVRRYHYETHEQLRAHLQLFVDAYDYARRLKTLRGLTPYKHDLQNWTKVPERFRLDPSHHIPGPYTSIWVSVGQARSYNRGRGEATAEVSAVDIACLMVAACPKLWIKLGESSESKRRYPNQR